MTIESSDGIILSVGIIVGLGGGAALTHFLKRWWEENELPKKKDVKNVPNEKENRINEPTDLDQVKIGFESSLRGLSDLGYTEVGGELYTVWNEKFPSHQLD